MANAEKAEVVEMIRSTTGTLKLMVSQADKEDVKSPITTRRVRFLERVIIAGSPVEVIIIYSI